MTGRAASTLQEMASELELSFVNRRGHYDVLRGKKPGERPSEAELHRMRDRLYVLRDAAHFVKAQAEREGGQ